MYRLSGDEFVMVFYGRDMKAADDSMTYPGAGQERNTCEKSMMSPSAMESQRFIRGYGISGDIISRSR